MKYQRLETKGKDMVEGWGTVLSVNIIIWLGIAGYFFMLDRKIRRVEKLVLEIKEENKGE